MKHKKISKGLALALVVIALFALTPLPVAGLTPSYTPSSAYRASTYYKNIKTLPLTGDGAFDTVSVALSQYGYHEGGRLADLGGGNTASAGNYTEYNYAFGKVGGSYGYAWCATFVSWCLSQAGEAGSAGGLFSSCTLWVDRLREIGQYKTRASGYRASGGDLIFFRSAGVSRASDHVGIVRYVSDGRVYTVEGNSSGKVTLRSYALGDTYIVGYGIPKYAGPSLSIDRKVHEDRTPGFYAVTYQFLNVRAAPGESAKKLGALKQGELVLVEEIRGEWGRIRFGDVAAYVSLRYADFVTPTTYRVRYVSEGETLLERKRFSTESGLVASLHPEREGYRFLHWTSDAGEVFSAADALPLGDLTLTAVYEALPPPTPEPPEVEEAPDAEPFLPPESIQPPSLFAPGEDEVPETVTPSHTVAAAQHAGVISALLALSLALLYTCRRRREE